MATDRSTIRSAIREWWINDVNKPSWFQDAQNEKLIDRIIAALDAAASVRAEAASAREIQQQIDAAVDAERKRCAEIVQLARHDEIDRDFRSIIHRIEDAWDPARLEDEKAELKEGK